MRRDYDVNRPLRWACMTPPRAHGLLMVSGGEHRSSALRAGLQVRSARSLQTRNNWKEEGVQTSASSALCSTRRRPSNLGGDALRPDKFRRAARADAVNQTSAAAG